MTTPVNCPVCNSPDSEVIYTREGVPVHAVLLHRSVESAVAARRGSLEIRYCGECGMFWNAAFDEALVQYDSDYEETQGYSETFNSFHHALARDLFNRYDLKGKRVLEIGCGKGDFLVALADLGIGHGIGFDPAFDCGRVASRRDLEFHTTLYPDEENASRATRADFYACKMTLEHINEPSLFLDRLLEAIGDSEATLYFLVPNAQRIIEEAAFWDIYYEHCNYFSAGSLTRLFQQKGLEILELDRLFDRQYLSLVARWHGQPDHTVDQVKLDDITAATALQLKMRAKMTRLHGQLQEGDRGNLIWGAASKACALLNAIPDLQQSTSLVDINPNKSGTWLPATRLRIEMPEYYQDRKFSNILVCNPVYENEIVQSLQAHNITGRVLLLK